jgi:hypothetical protein
MPSVILKKGKEHRLIAGHSWVYAGEIARITGEPADGLILRTEMLQATAELSAAEQRKDTQC